MSTITQYLLLVDNASSDSFRLSDFTSNWGSIDAAPGQFICTSETHPTWTVEQAGRTIIETDTQNILMWNGTTFVATNPV